MSVPNVPPDDSPEGASPTGRGYWFTPLPVYLLEAVYDPGSPVNAPAAILWVHIHRNYAWRERVFPSYARLAEETGQSESAVKRQLNMLKAAGAIIWGATYRTRGRSSNEYALAVMEPFRFDRETAPLVQVKNDLHPSVGVKNDPSVQTKSDLHPQVKNDLVVESSSYLESTEDLSLPSSPKPAAESAAAACEEREMISASQDKPTTTTTAAAVVQVPALRGEERQQQGQDGPQEPFRASAVAAGASESAQRIVDAYTAAVGRPVLARTRSALHDQAAELLAAGFPEQWLADRARELAAHGWTDLAKHAEKSTVPLPGAKPAGSSVPPWCGKCDGEPLAERWREGDDGRAYRCPDCNPNVTPALAVKPQRGGYRPFQCPPASAYSLGFYGEPLPGTDTTVVGWLALADGLEAQDAPAAGADGADG